MMMTPLRSRPTLGFWGSGYCRKGSQGSRARWISEGRGMSRGERKGSDGCGSRTDGYLAGRGLKVLRRSCRCWSCGCEMRCEGLVLLL